MNDLRLPVTASELNALIDVKRRINVVGVFIPEENPPHSVFKILLFELICAHSYACTLLRLILPQNMEIIPGFPITSENPVFFTGEHKIRFDFNNTTQMLVIIRDAIKETGGILEYVMKESEVLRSEPFVHTAGLLIGHLAICRTYIADHLNKMMQHATKEVQFC